MKKNHNEKLQKEMKEMEKLIRQTVPDAQAQTQEKAQTKIQEQAKTMLAAAKKTSYAQHDAYNDFQYKAEQAKEMTQFSRFLTTQYKDKVVILENKIKEIERELRKSIKKVCNSETKIF